MKEAIVLLINFRYSLKPGYAFSVKVFHFIQTTCGCLLNIP